MTHPVHSLRQSDITYIRNWDEWKKQWQLANLVELRLGLLHLGFGISLEDIPGQPRENGACTKRGVDRICLYLDLADGHLERMRFIKSHENLQPDPRIRSAVGRTDAASLRQEISKKAFGVLCTDIFLRFDANPFPTSKSSPLGHWSDPAALRKFLWFFRPTGTSTLYNVENIGNGKNIRAEAATSFALWLCRFLLGIDEKRHFPELQKELGEQLFSEFRPKAIEILATLNKLDILIQGNFQPDLQSLLTLKKLAMDTLFPNDSASARETRTLEEAVASGSPAARVLLVLMASERALKKLKKLQNSETKWIELSTEVHRLVKTM